MSELESWSLRQLAVALAFCSWMFMALCSSYVALCWAKLWGFPSCCSRLSARCWSRQCEGICLRWTSHHSTKCGKPAILSAYSKLQCNERPIQAVLTWNRCCVTWLDNANGWSYGWIVIEKVKPLHLKFSRLVNKQLVAICRSFARSSQLWLLQILTMLVEP